MQTFFVTGANRGIGLELCRGLAERGERVIAGCRSASPEIEALDVEVIDNVDVTSGGSLQRLAERLEGINVDCLVNNAGILERDSLDDLDPESVERQFRVNALGPLLVTRALLPNLRRGSKVCIVTSRMGSIGDNTSGGYYGYRMSKAAVNMAGMSLARDLRERGVAVGILHPGMVATRMTGGNGIPPADAARGLLNRIDEIDLNNSGAFRHANGESLPW